MVGRPHERPVRELNHDDNATVFGEDSAMRVLIVEDEVKLASLIRKGLRAEGVLPTSPSRAGRT
jgi:hypothetical protein